MHGSSKHGAPSGFDLCEEVGSRRSGFRAPFHFGRLAMLLPAPYSAFLPRSRKRCDPGFYPGKGSAGVCLVPKQGAARRISERPFSLPPLTGIPRRIASVANTGRLLCCARVQPQLLRNRHAGARLHQGDRPDHAADRRGADLGCPAFLRPR
jgi:hypothetical protein